MTTVTFELTDYVEFMCYRIATAPDLTALATKGKALKIDIDRKEDYTLVEGAIDRMRAAYKMRSEELRGSK